MAQDQLGIPINESGVLEVEEKTKGSAEADDMLDGLADGADIKIPQDQAQTPDTKISKSMKDILGRKQYRRRKMYKAAWKMLLTAFEDGFNLSDSSIESEDMMDASDEERDKQKTINKPSTSSDPADHKSDGHRKGSTNKVPGQRDTVLYNTELYKYLKDGPNRKPELSRSFPGLIIAEKETPDRHFKSGEAPIVMTSLYAITKDISIEHRSSRVRVRCRIGDYISMDSAVILEAIRSVVKFYPSKSPYGEILTIFAPYCILVHHLNELREYDELLKSAPEKLAVQGSKASSNRSSDLSALLNFLDDEIGPDLSAEQTRNRQGLCTFAWIWHLFKPGSTVYAWQYGTLRAYVVDHHSADTQTSLRLYNDKVRPQTVHNMNELDNTHRPKNLTVSVWHLEYDGSHLRRMPREFTLEPFEGEKVIKMLPLFPMQYLLKDDNVNKNLPVEQTLIQRGREFCKLMQRSYQDYQGHNVNQVEKGGSKFRRQISGRVMVDSRYFYEFVDPFSYELMENKPRQPHYKRERDEMPEKEEKEAEPDSHVRQSNEFYAKWAAKKPDEISQLPDTHYLVCNHTVWAFVLRTREWELLDVTHLKEPEYQSTLIESLVLKPEAKSMIQALANRYTASEQPDTPVRSADFISNKGEGHIFLLHGKPGVGKTTTAECVAEMTKRPLLSLTCGDLGLVPLEVEKALMKWMMLAAHWGAVLLLDEADIYLESRISQDLQRNSLVSIFLHAMEYYQSILFLTTNRVGTFDPGFISRVHIIIHYPDFSDDQRSQIWDNFFNKLEREHDNFRISSRTIEYAKTDSTLRDLKWNGREIRNAFNTAVALAEYENKRDPKGAIMMSPTHLEQVVKMSRSFRDYMTSTLGMDQARVAKLHKVRDDNWQDLKT